MTMRTRRSAAVRMGSLLAAVMLSLSACSEGPALREEGTPSGGPPEVSASALALPSQDAATTKEAEDWEKPFGPEKIRKLLLAADLSPLAQDGQDPGELKSYLRRCNHCLVALAPYSAQDERFQLLSVTSSGDGFAFASFAVRDVAGKPELALMVGGTDIYLSGGNYGALVAQEAVYGTDDPVCCPEKWKARLFRFENGEFVPGGTYTGDNTVPPTSAP